ncbi:hypothetical protein PTNB85_10475 [Pyrenophora teres f. teres]|uniref:Uncharacterized protein n=1 Tax=Pyrenophora teres f. teres TaxID=97479 RepID=A0A6S6WEM2_9PLEO|nr:hypothetical protein PTNB85_10475 [Pyrenophora teres f. teres]KAE8823849.1 hypothetical protein HRS9139_09031 [Pyrenophora teres f. teres]KAE8854898.1 hypothetical protein PTNB29_09149 [Pyrenophora teres f. teres]CAE7213243.1 hypothetical protein PTTW11_10421 [Pyrenophora teres f. teres]
MTHYLVRKQGIPVLARSRPDAAAPWPCTLFARYSDTQAQASLYIRFSIPVYGFSQDQTFTLIYDADNLVPGVNSIKPATTSLPQDQLDQLGRSGNPQLRVLALTVKQPCSIRCPHSTGSLGPKNGYEVPFHQLRKIAQATEIDVLLDYNWVHTVNRALLDKVLERPEELAGLVENGKYTKQHKRVDWTVFGPVDQEDPPPYASASQKRSRQTATSSLPKYPSPKRILLDAAIFPGSPTEKATTTTQSPSPRPPSSHVLATPDIQEAVNKAVALYLPIALKMHLERLLDDAVEYAYDLRNQADGEFEDVIADHKIDIAGIKDDGIDEMNRVVNDKLSELKEQAQDIVDDAVEKMQDGALEAYDSIDGKLIAMLDEHDAYLRRQRERSGRWHTLHARGQRSVSLPL